MDSLQRLRDRLAELSDLGALEMLAEWDQLVMMPSEGGPARAQQLGTLARLRHERATDERIGAWLTELDGEELGELDRDIVRLGTQGLGEGEARALRARRRDRQRGRGGPGELAAGAPRRRLRRLPARPAA